MHCMTGVVRMNRDNYISRWHYRRDRVTVGVSNTTIHCRTSAASTISSSMEPPPYVINIVLPAGHYVVANNSSGAHRHLANRYNANRCSTISGKSADHHRSSQKHRRQVFRTEHYTVHNLAPLLTEEFTTALDSSHSRNLQISQLVVAILHFFQNDRGGKSPWFSGYRCYWVTDWLMTSENS